MRPAAGNSRRRAVHSISALSAVLFLTVLPVRAAGPQLRFTKQVNLPGAGLTLNLMSRYTEVPTPPPTIYTYVAKGGPQDGQTVEMYAPIDLWRTAQRAGGWTDPDQNQLVLAIARFPVPPAFPREHVPRADYEAGMKATASPDWNAPDTFLADWVAAFAGSAPVAPVVIAKHSSRLRDIIAFSFGPKTPYPLAYAFRLSRYAPAQRNASTNWFCLFLCPNPALDLKAVDMTVQRELLDSISSSLTTAPPPAPTVAARKADGDRSPEFLASRQQVADSIRNMKDWWLLETRNYIILSNLKNRNHMLVQELRSSIETLRSVFEGFLPPTSPPTAVSVIRVFATPEEYMAYVGKQFEWTSGVWMPDRKELVIKPQEWGSNKEQREGVLRVTYHEAFHQYLHVLTQPRTAAPWFNEGHASFFEMTTVRDRGLTLQEDERFVERILEVIPKASFSLKPLLAMTYPQFYNPSPSDRELNYAMSWALVYYLRRGCLVDGRAVYGAIPGRYRVALTETGDPDAATEQAFAGVDTAEFQRAFAAFWQSRNKRGEARRIPMPAISRK